MEVKIIDNIKCQQKAYIYYKNNEKRLIQLCLNTFSLKNKIQYILTIIELRITFTINHLGFETDKGHFDWMKNLVSKYIPCDHKKMLNTIEMFFDLKNDFPRAVQFVYNIDDAVFHADKTEIPRLDNTKKNVIKTRLFTAALSKVHV